MSGLSQPLVAGRLVGPAGGDMESSGAERLVVVQAEIASQPKSGSKARSTCGVLSAVAIVALLALTARQHDTIDILETEMLRAGCQLRRTGRGLLSGVLQRWHGVRGRRLGSARRAEHAGGARSRRAERGRALLGRV
jgi:hypothetical protein